MFAVLTPKMTFWHYDIICVKKFSPMAAAQRMHADHLMPKTPIHPVPKSCGHPKSITKLTQNEPEKWPGESLPITYQPLICLCNLYT